MISDKIHFHIFLPYTSLNTVSRLQDRWSGFISHQGS